MHADVEEETKAVMAEALAEQEAVDADLPEALRRRRHDEAEAFLSGQVYHLEQVGVGRALPDHLRMAWAGHLRSQPISAEAG